MHERALFGSKLVLEQSEYRTLDFTGVSMRTFPLRANLVQLQRLCDAYLNVDVPREIAYFRPLAPYVLFQIINYGRMSPATHSLGWVSQHEVLFGIPVVGRWYEDGEQVEGVATVTPFIFVDNDWSVISGREIYGWPKYPASLTPEVNQWIQDPRFDPRLMTLKTMLFPDLYSGKTLELLPLLEVTQEAPLLLQAPPDVDYLMSPLTRIPRAFVDTMASLPDVFQNLAQMWSQGDAGILTGAAQGLAQGLLGLPPEMLLNSVNLKQFRSSDARKAIYQSLVLGKLKVTKYHGGGLLGDVEQLRGDPTGGFNILIHRYPDFPIIESLGLEVENEFTSADVRVAALKPVWPSWVDLDLQYSRGVRLCWRTQRTRWAINSQPPPPEPAKREAMFNSVLGPIVSPVEGPFDFLGTTLRILPLCASDEPNDLEIRELRKEMGLPHDDRPKVQEVLEELLAEPVKRAVQEMSRQEDNLGEAPDLDVQIKAEFLKWHFLVVKRSGPLTAASNNLGWWGGRSVDVTSILKLTITVNRSQTYSVHFLVVPYAFADTPQAVGAGREILGLPTAFSRIRAGTDPWIDSSVATGIPRCLLEIDVRDYPALGVGQAARERPLMEIHRVRAPEAEPLVPEYDLLNQRLARFRDTIRDRYSDGLRVSTLSFKQFPDEEDPALICYRALQAQERILGCWASQALPDVQIQELPGSYEIRIHELPSWSIVRDLNLAVERWEVSRQGGPVAVLKVDYPHWMKVDLRWNLPVDLKWQSVDGEWQVGRRSASYLAWLLSLSEMRGLRDLLGSSESDEFLGRLLAAIRAPIASAVTSPQAGDVKSLDDLISDFEAFHVGISATSALDASREDVWRALTDPTWLGDWLGEPVELPPGGSGWLGTGDRRLAIEAETYQPMRRITWRLGLDRNRPLADSEAEVEVECRLEPRDAGGTDLVVTAAGFPADREEKIRAELGKRVGLLTSFLDGLARPQPRPPGAKAKKKAPKARKRKSG